MTSEPDAMFITLLLFGPLLLGVFQFQLFEPGARAWHHSLNKSPYRPPSFVFPLVWIWSYLSIGYASYLVYRADRASAIMAYAISVPLYALHLLLQNLWGFFFLFQRKVASALNIMLALVVTASWLLVSVYCIDKFAAALCVPYFCWLLELTYLNMYMMLNNNSNATKEQVLRAHATPFARSAVVY